MTPFLLFWANREALLLDLANLALGVVTLGFVLWFAYAISRQFVERARHHETPFQPTASTAGSVHGSGLVIWREKSRGRRNGRQR